MRLEQKQVRPKRSELLTASIYSRIRWMVLNDFYHAGIKLSRKFSEMFFH